MKLLKALPLFFSFGCLILLVNLLCWGDFKRKLANFLVSVHSRWLLKALDFKVTVIGDLPKGNHLIISNHLSYADIFVIASLLPSVFVTSQDVGRDLVSGTIVRLAGCLLVDRKRFTTLIGDIKEMSILLDKGFNVVLFPEATTSTGNILPFKPALITAAEHGGVPVLSLALRYNNLKKIVYSGTSSLIPHLLDFLQTDNLGVEVEVCDVSHPRGCRKETAKRLHGTIKEKTHKY